MFSPTLSLSVLSLAVLCYPSGVAQIIALITKRDNRNAASKFILISIIIMLINLAMVAIYVPYYNTFDLRMSNPLIIIAGLLLGIVALLIEYALGYIMLKLQKKRVGTRIAVHSDWSNADWKLWVGTIVYALIEEILYRGVFAYILLNLLGLHAWTFVLISSITYALNHLRLGASVVLQKWITGIIFAIFYIITGGNILAVILAHMLQNILVLLLGRKRQQGRLK